MTEKLKSNPSFVVRLCRAGQLLESKRSGSVSGPINFPFIREGQEVGEVSFRFKRTSYDRPGDGPTLFDFNIKKDGQTIKISVSEDGDRPSLSLNGSPINIDNEKGTSVFDKIVTELEESLRVHDVKSREDVKSLQRAANERLIAALEKF